MSYLYVFFGIVSRLTRTHARTPFFYIYIFNIYTTFCVSFCLTCLSYPVHLCYVFIHVCALVGLFVNYLSYLYTLCCVWSYLSTMLLSLISFIKLLSSIYKTNLIGMVYDLLVHCMFPSCFISSYCIYFPLTKLFVYTSVIVRFFLQHPLSLCHLLSSTLFCLTCPHYFILFLSCLILVISDIYICYLIYVTYLLNLT